VSNDNINTCSCCSEKVARSCIKNRYCNIKEDNECKHEQGNKMQTLRGSA
jgi:hypothetical protein